MTYRIYLRWPGGKVSHKTTTEVEEVAEFAFDHLRRMKELRGQTVSATMTLEGKNVHYHDFKAAVDSDEASGS
jgi:hypothetical protein